MDIPPWFGRFLDLAADRTGELFKALSERGVDPRVVDLAGGRFIVAWPRNSVRDPRYRVKVVTAHHDRVMGTPGALDNSAACLQLVEFICSDEQTFNTLAVFTDREELGHPPAGARAGERSGSPWPAEQGSYSLGKAFSGMGFQAPMVFPLDVTGRGDAIVLSKAAAGLLSNPVEPAAANSGLLALIAETDAMALTVSRMMAGRAPVYRIAVPFGEDLGFLCAGVPALTVTVLPRAEAETLISRDRLPAWATTSPPGDRMPETWKRLHGPDDTPALFTDGAFSAVGRFLGRLGGLRVPLAVAPRM